MFKLAGVEVRRGEKRQVHLKVNTDEVGKVAIPVIVVNGTRKGPTFLAIAGEHGIEVNGSICVWTAANELVPHELAGVLIAIPFVNPWNLKVRRHFRSPPIDAASPADAFNTYARWPGRPDGVAGERIAHAIVSQLLRRADYFVNLHGWARSASSIFGYRAFPQTILMARNFGLKFYHVFDKVMKEAPLRRTSFEYSNEIGIPACLVELNTQWEISVKSVSEGTRGIRNLLKQFKLLEGRPELPPEQFRCSGSEIIVRAPHPGVFVPQAQAEQYVRRGDLLGFLLNPDTLKSTEILAPMAGGVWEIGRMGKSCDVNLESRHAFADERDIVAIVKKVRIELSEPHQTKTEKLHCK